MNAKVHTDNLIATDNPNAFVGAIVMWHLSGDVELSHLEGSWKTQGLSDKLLPDLPSPEVALTRTVEQYSKGQIFKRRIKGGGYRLVQEVNPEEERAEYTTVCSIVLDENDDPIVTLFDYEGFEGLETDFRRHQLHLTPRDMSPWLCGKMMRHLGATALKSNGGVYFVPRDRVDELGKVKAAIEAVTGHRIFRVKAMTDDEAVEMVLDAITREAEAAAQAVEDDLTIETNPELGTRALGARALENRADTCRDLLSKVSMYEELLDCRLDTLRERIDDLKIAALEASLAARGDD